MSRNRGRPTRQYRLRIRSVRRTPIDYDALARAALEQAAMNEQEITTTTERDQPSRLDGRGKDLLKGPRHDRLE